MKLVSPLRATPVFSRIPGSSVPDQPVKRLRSTFLLPLAPLLALAAFAFGPASFGQTSTWNGTTGADIGTAANWIGGLPSVSSGTGIGEWSGGVAGALNLTLSNANLAGTAGNAGMTMSLTSAQTSAVSINTGAVTNGIRLNAITIASGAGALTLGDGATTAGDLTLTLGQGSGNRLFTNNSSNTATLNSDVVIGTGGGVARTIEFAGSGNWTVNNNLGGPNGTATITVVKSGAGTLTLTATNNFTGGITVQSGTLVTTGSAASSNGTVTLGDTTPSNSNSATWNTTGFNPVNNITVNAGSSGILAITGSSLTTSQTFSGNITLNNSLTVAALTSTFMNTYSGVISGTGGLNIGNTGITNVGGTGGVTLTGTNTYAGNTAINSGTLQIGGAGSLGTAGIYAGSIANNGTFKYSSSANQTFSGQITGTGGLLKQTSLTSTLTLSNSTSTFTGGIYLTEGTLSIASIADYGSASSLGYGTAGTTNVIFGYAANTGTLLYTGTGNTSNRTIQIGQNSTPAVTDTGGATIQNDGSGALTFTATTFNAQTNASTGVGANRVLTLQGSNTGANTIQGIIRDNLVSGSGTGTATVGVTKAGSGNWTLSGTNTYTGVTILGNGTLSVGTIGNGGVAGNLGKATNAAANIVFDGGTLQYTGATSTSDRAFTINAGKTATIDIANNLTLAGATGNATTGSLTKTGAGTLTLNGTQTYTGNTAINSGTLQIGAAGSLGAAGTYAGSIANNGAFKYSSSANQTFSGQITGTGGLLKQTSLTSTLTLSNSTSTFTGGIYLTEGTLSIASIANYGSASALGYGTAGTVNVVFGFGANTGTLLYTGTGNTSNRTIQIGQNNATPAVTDTGGATIQNDGSGALTFTAGTFNSVTTNAATGVGADRTLTLQGSNAGANTIQGVIRNNLVSGSGTGTATVGVTKSGAGTWVLSGTNTYTGATAVSEGTLLINGSTTGSAFSVSNAGSTLGGNGTITPGANHALAVNLGSILAPGVTGTAGNLTIALTNTGDSAAFATGSTFAFDLGAPGTNDKLVFTGLAAGVHDVTFNSNVVNFSSLGGLAQGAYTLFTFDANNAYTGTLQIGTGLESFATSNFTYNANSIVLNVVPEPQTWALLAFSLTTVMVLRRRRNS